MFFLFELNSIEQKFIVLVFFGKVTLFLFNLSRVQCLKMYYVLILVLLYLNSQGFRNFKSLKIICRWVWERNLCLNLKMKNFKHKNLWKNILNEIQIKFLVRNHSYIHLFKLKVQEILTNKILNQIICKKALFVYLSSQSYLKF